MVSFDVSNAEFLKFGILNSHLLLFLNLGAGYHRAEATMQMLDRLKVPITMMGPYSYSAQAAELFFAAFKKADINPRKIPLGKTHFQDVVQLVVNRCREIPR